MATMGECSFSGAPSLDAPFFYIPQKVQRRRLIEKEKNTVLKIIGNKSFIISVVILLLVMALFGCLYLLIRSDFRQELSEKDDEIGVLKEQVNAAMNKLEEKEKNETIPVITSETLEEKLSALSELVTYEYNYRNADRRESSETWIFGWERPFSGKSILVSYDGVIKAGIDFKEIDIQVDEAEHTITVTLPESKITDNYISQDSIEVLEAKDGLFNKVTFDNYNEFISDQKVVMEQKAIDQGVLEKATEEARNLITAFLSSVPGIEEYKLTVQ